MKNPWKANKILKEQNIDYFVKICSLEGIIQTQKFDNIAKSMTATSIDKRRNTVSKEKYEELEKEHISMSLELELLKNSMVPKKKFEITIIDGTYQYIEAHHYHCGKFSVYKDTGIYVIAQFKEDMILSVIEAI